MADARNVYGCTPCPKCSGAFRWIRYEERPSPDPGPEYLVICDDCGDTDAADDATITASGLRDE